MSLLGFPEDHIITIKKYELGTYYDVARTPDERAKLIEEIEKEKIREKFLKRIVKLVHSIDRRASVDLEMTKEGEPDYLTIYIPIMTDQLDPKEVNIIEEELRKKGFEIEKNPWSLTGLKSADLEGKKTLRELQELVKVMMK